MNNAAMTDRTLMVWIVGALGLVALVGDVALLFMILNALDNAKVDGTELAVMVGAAGGLGNLVTGVIGWFAPSPLSKSSIDGPTDVKVVNEGPREAVPVDAEGGWTTFEVVVGVCIVAITFHLLFQTCS